MENEDMLTEIVSEAVDKALGSTIKKMISEELPKGEGSSIANKIHHEKASETEFYVIIETPVWDYLSEGTGIYNPEYSGQGEGGAIVPINAKALHFKNREIAAALGFENEDVFLKKVRGISPRYLWDRYFDSDMFVEEIMDMMP